MKNENRNSKNPQTEMEEEEEKRSPEPEMKVKEEEEEEEEEEEKKKKKKKKKKRKNTEMEEVEDKGNPEPEMEVKKRNPEPDMEVEEEEEKRNPEPEMELEEEEEKKKKKKKKKKRKKTEMEEEEEEKGNHEPEMEAEVEEEKTEKKKRKKKKKDRNPVEEMAKEDDNNVIQSEEKKEIKVKMEIVPGCSDKISPIVGYFPSGFNFQKATHQPDVKVYRHKEKSNRSNRLQLVVSPRNSNIDFVGTSYTGEAAASQVCTYALGVLDKETQCLKIVPIACNKIFRLEPRVAGSESNEKALVEMKEGAVTEDRTVYGTKFNYLTKKARKKAEKNAKMKRKEDATVEKSMEKKIKNIVVNENAMEITAASAVRNIPHHDSTATTPEQAYPLDKIISQSEWHYLKDVLQCVQSKKELPSNDYPRFVCNRAQKLLNIKDEKKRDTLAGIFSFINHLIKFKDQRTFATKDLVKNHRIPGVLFRKFNEEFTDTGKLESSAEKKDLLISHVLVLTLYADSFKTDPTDIAKDLRLTKISLRPYFLNLGCKLSKVDKQDVMTLPVPLEFPKPSSERRRRKPMQ